MCHERSVPFLFGRIHRVARTPLVAVVHAVAPFRLLDLLTGRAPGVLEKALIEHLSPTLASSPPGVDPLVPPPLRIRVAARETGVPPLSLLPPKGKALSSWLVAQGPSCLGLRASGFGLQTTGFGY